MSVHEGAIATALHFSGELEQVKKPEAVEYKRMMEKGWSKIDKNSM